jgi:hypothetical protein
VEAVPPAFRAVDVAADRLVADRGSAPFLFRPSGDPLRRPAGLRALDHVLTQGGVGGQLAAALPASARQVLRVQGEVAAEPPVAVAEAVAAQPPVDRRGVTAEPRGDLADRPAGLDHAEEGAAFVEVEVTVGPGQGCLRGAIPWEGWGFAPRDRTHRTGARRSRGQVAGAARAEDHDEDGTMTFARPIEAGSQAAAVISPVGQARDGRRGSGGRVAAGFRPSLPTCPSRDRSPGRASGRCPASRRGRLALVAVPARRGRGRGCP